MIAAASFWDDHYALVILKAFFILSYHEKT